MSDVNGLTPEERAHHLGKARQRLDRQIAKVRPGSYAFEILKRTSLGVFNDGFIHAGNLAYLALMTLFPFFITTAALLSLFGQSNETQHAVESFLHVLPPMSANCCASPSPTCWRRGPDRCCGWAGWSAYGRSAGSSRRSATSSTALTA
ncbi:hypothetical protein GCM10020258_24650 [Sphingomonas yabuuchiae]